MSNQSANTQGALNAYKIYLELKKAKQDDLMAAYTKQMKSTYIDDDDAYATYWDSVAAEKNDKAYTDAVSKTK
jgi:hypothetical protein